MTIRDYANYNASRCAPKPKERERAETRAELLAARLARELEREEEIRRRDAIVVEESTLSDTFVGRLRRLIAPQESGGGNQ